MNGIIYARFGAKRISSSLTSEYGSIKLSKIAPVVGLGIEKSLSKFSGLFVRLEVDYALRMKKTRTFSKNGIIIDIDNDINFTADRSARIKEKLDSYSVRLMLGRNF